MKESWSDDKLFAKFDLSEEEISFIDNMIRPMVLTTNESDDE